MEKIDTIVSLITGQGKSAVSVIRLSGADAFNMLRNLGIDFSLEHHRILWMKMSIKEILR